MNQVVYHLKLNAALIEHAKYAIVPGDPGRVPLLAFALDKEAKLIANNREYCSYLAHLNDIPVVICSTGIGGPSTSIALEELAQCGVKHFLRVGTAGAIQPHIQVGELAIITAAIRLDGASTHYAPLAYPAIASFQFTNKILECAQRLDIRHQIGIAVSSDTFYPGQERYDSYTGYVPLRFQGSMKEWQALNALCYEMETATLFTLCNVFKLHAACFCAIVSNRTHSENIDPKGIATGLANAGILLKESLLTYFSSQDTVR